MNREQQLEWEERLGRPVAFAAFGAALLLLAQIVLLQSLIEDRRGVEPIPDFLLSVEDNAGLLMTSRGAQALASLLLVPIFLYLFRAIQARAQTIPSWFVWLVYAGPVLYAVGLVLGALNQIDVAGDFADGLPVRGDAGDERADDLLQDDTNALVFGLNFAGSVAVAFLFVMLPLRARRVGLMSPFMGILGVIAGALLVLQLVPLVPVVVEAFWLGALGALFLGHWPGGRGPAWETGEAAPWPTPAQRRGQAPPPDAQEPAAELDPTAPVEPEPEPKRPSSRKRKRR